MKQFILLPNINKTCKIKPNDILVYLIIRSYENQLSYTFPSLKVIAEKTNLSYKFVNDSINRLENEGFLIIERGTNHRNNRYRMMNYEKEFNLIPYNFINLKLDPTEKSILLLIRQFFTDTFETFETIKGMSEKLGIPIRTFSRYISSLKEHGFLESKSAQKSDGKIINILSLKNFDWCVKDDNYSDLRNANINNLETTKKELIKLVIGN